MRGQSEEQARPPRVLIAGGGTGGHLYPGIAVARELLCRDPCSDVSFVGTAQGLEARVVPHEGFRLDCIRSAGLKGKSLTAVVWSLALGPLSVVDAWRVLARRRPDLVIGVGGYSSGAVVLLATLRGIPAMVLEQNAVPGLTNRWLARVVDAAAVSYEVTLPYFRGRGFVSGNPVREEFFTTADASLIPGSGPRRLLVFGGSQGAHAINLAMIAATPHLAAARDRLSIVHQAGERDQDPVRQAYRQVRLDARVEPFIHAMAQEMHRADLVVCRAGATTIAEITAAGRASVLVPLPVATDDHQRRNAGALVTLGAAQMIEERTLTGAVLAQNILELVDDDDRRVLMAAAARQVAKPDATRVTVDRALALLGAGKGE